MWWRREPDQKTRSSEKLVFYQSNRCEVLLVLLFINAKRCNKNNKELEAKSCWLFFADHIFESPALIEQLIKGEAAESDRKQKMATGVFEFSIERATGCRKFQLMTREYLMHTNGQSLDPLSPLTTTISEVALLLTCVQTKLFQTVPSFKTYFLTLIIHSASYNTDRWIKGFFILHFHSL